MDKKVDCKYGKDCYQKNPAHKEKYRHPGDSDNGSVEEKADKTGEKRNSSEFSPNKKAEDNKKQKVVDEEMKEVDGDDKDQNMESASGSRPRIFDPNLPQFEKVDMNDLEFINDIYDKQIRFSQRKEYAELLENPKEFMRHKFIHIMPEDFYQFWELCKSMNKDAPEQSFSKVGLQLVGPFDFMAGKFHKAALYEPGDYLRHWRFYYDPPEFQTVLVKKGTGIHYGYWRDDPSPSDCYIARNDYKQGCAFKIFDTNIFNAVLYYLDNDVELTPFNRPTVNSLRKSVQDWMTANNIKADDAQEQLRKRNKKVVCKTFHGAGLVVPVDKKTDVGYRPLLENDATIKKILAPLSGDGKNAAKADMEQVMVKLQPIITMATIAVDESDFGTPIELGIDLFCNGSPELHDVAKRLFIMGYTMIQKPQFIAIVKSHLDNRKHGTELSILE